MLGPNDNGGNGRSPYYDSLPSEVTMGVCPLTPQGMDAHETAAIRASERRNQPGYDQPSFYFSLPNQGSTL